MYSDSATSRASSGGAPADTSSAVSVATFCVSTPQTRLDICGARSATGAAYRSISASTSSGCGRRVRNHRADRSSSRRAQSSSVSWHAAGALLSSPATRRQSPGRSNTR